jgi:hypothetical protein
MVDVKSLKNVLLLGEIKKTQYKLTGTLFCAVHFFYQTMFTVRS